MALSVVDLYTKVLPKTNCKDCGFPTCIAFAGMVVSEMHPLKNCPHVPADVLAWAEPELAEQYAQGKWLKKDMAQEALTLAKERTADMALPDIARRIGGTMDGPEMVLPYFDNQARITAEGEIRLPHREPTRNEQTFIHIHMAMGGSRNPTGNMKSFKEFPNTVSKVKSMESHVEAVLVHRFSGRADELDRICKAAGGSDLGADHPSPERAYGFQVFPKISVTLLFWDAHEDFDAEVKLLFDETIVEHLDIECIMFLSEHLTQQLTEKLD